MNALPADTIRLITSTQVITSLYSIVKELVENSLDANATNIEIKLENYGFEKIELRDDGDGIPLDNVPFMGQQHFTSKISQMSDLHQLLTYGFRGEALASLCAIASVTIATKTDEDPISMVYTLDHQGKISASKPCHLGKGTTVTAINIFKNTPVRKQFFGSIKRRKDELRKVEDLMMQFAVIKPDVRFVLRNDKTVLLQKNKVANHKAALTSVWGRNVMNEMEEVLIMHENVEVECILPKPDADILLVSRTSNDRCWVFVNGRPVSQREIEKIIKHCVRNCHPTQSSNRYPIAFVSISVPPDAIDVNLEPNKTKVLLQEKESILEAIEVKLQEIYKIGTKEDENLDPACLSTNVQNKAQEGSERLPAQEQTLTPNASFDDNRLISKTQKDKYISGDHRINSNSNVFSTSGLASHRTEMESFPQEKACHSLAEETNPSIEAHNRLVNTSSISLTSPQNGPLFQEVPTSSSISNESDMCAEFSATAVNDIDVLVNLEAINVPKNSSFSVIEEASTELNSKLDQTGEMLAKEDNICDIPKSKRFDLLPSTLSDSALMEFLGTNLDESEASLVETTADGILQSANDISAPDWSKGKGIVDELGRSVEPGKILIPTGNKNVVPENNNNSENQNKFLRIETNVKTPCREKKPIQEKMGQATFYNLVGKTPIKRPRTAYIFFSKEVRPQIIEANPTADFQTISKLTGERWKALGDEEKGKFEELMKQDVQRYKEEVKEAKKNGAMQEPARKKKCIKQPPQQSLINKLFPSPSRQPAPINPVIKSVDVNFSCTALKAQLKIKYREPDAKTNLIGQLSCGFWIVKEGDQLQILNHCRIEETLLYHRLLAEHKLQTQQLQPPITLSPNMIGGTANWQTLMLLKSEISCIDGTRMFTDDRLTANGFEIKHTQDPETENARVQVTAMATNIPFYGLADLAEILDLIGSSSNSLSLQECRPSKLTHYLQGEAVRLARGLPHRCTEDDIIDMIDRQRERLTPNTQSCIHNKPFIQALHNINF